MSWYEIVEGSNLFQGDILQRCPVFTVAGQLTWPLSDKNADIGIAVTEYDLVIMSQSCDLQNDKVNDVLLAQVMAWEDVVATEMASGNQIIKSKKFRKLLIDGNVPGLSLLHEHTEEPILQWSVVDFHRLFTLPKTFIQQYATNLGPRLRLKSPYREHLSQAFARYFMRVGLPHDASAFEQAF